MKTRPFAIASAASGTLQVLYLLVTAVVSTLITRSVFQDLNDALADPFASPNPPPVFLVTGIIGVAAVLLAPLVHLGTGVLYAILHRRESLQLTAEQSAVGGAASASLARVIAGLANGLISTFAAVYMMQFLGAQPGLSPAGAPPDAFPFFLGFGVLGGVFGAIVSTCFGAVFAAALGALGGALVGAFAK